MKPMMVFFNIDAEKCTLSGMLRDITIIPKIADIVQADDFYSKGHRRIFQGILNGDLSHESPEYIGELIDFLPTSRYTHYFARIVERAATFRRMVG